MLLIAGGMLASLVAPRAEAADACSGAQIPFAGRPAPRFALSGVLPVEPAPAPARPAEPEFERATHPRHAKLREAERRLLLQEIWNVKRLLDVTPRRASDRPRVIRRLADGWAELGDMLTRDRGETLAEARRLAKSDPSVVPALRRRAAVIGRRILVCRATAIDLHQRLLEEHPGYCRFPRARRSERGCGDEVLFNLAYEYERAGEGERARDAYEQLVAGWPRSKHAAHAFLALGEHYFGQAGFDTARWVRAQWAYQGALRASTSHDEVWVYAHYKLGHVQLNLGKPRLAMDRFRVVIGAGVARPRLPNAAALTAAARRDLVAVFALDGDPARAFEIFAPLSGDGPGKSEATVAMVRKLGGALMAAGRYQEAVVAFGSLLRRDEGPHACGYQAQIVQATLALRAADKPAIVGALEGLVDRWVASRSAGLDGDAELACARATATLLIETAMTWHLEAVGSERAPGTASSGTMDLADQLYRRVQQHFSPAELERLRFPQQTRDDWPTAASVRYAHGDLLFARGKWRECASAFSDAYQAEGGGPHAAASLLGAAECWQRALGQGGVARARPDRSPRELGADEGEALAALERYHCVVQPPVGDPDALELHLSLERTRAELHLAASRVAARTRWPGPRRRRSPRVTARGTRWRSRPSRSPDRRARSS